MRNLDGKVAVVTGLMLKITVAIHRICVLKHAANFRKIVPPDRLDPPTL
jgi:hypothetical protein